MDQNDQQFSQDTQRSNGSKKSSSSFKIGGIIVLLVAVAAIAGLHYFGFIKLGNVAKAPQASASVAMVNGEAIERAEFDKRFTQVNTAITTQQGPLDATSTSKLRDSVLEEMINTKLLLQEANKAGITVTQEDIDKSYADLLKNFGTQEKLDEQLSAVGMTKDELLSNIRNERLIQAYLDAKTEIKSLKVTDEEIKAFYDQQFEGQKDAPKLEDVKAPIQSQLLQQKTAALIQAKVAELRTQSEIKMTL